MNCDKCGSELTLEQEVKMLRKEVEELRQELATRKLIQDYKPIPWQPIQITPWNPTITYSTTSTDNIDQ